jgi:hypothetical protein
MVSKQICVYGSVIETAPCQNMGLRHLMALKCGLLFRYGRRAAAKRLGMRPPPPSLFLTQSHKYFRPVHKLCHYVHEYCDPAPMRIVTQSIKPGIQSVKIVITQSHIVLSVTLIKAVSSTSIKTITHSHQHHYLPSLIKYCESLS